MQYTRESRVAAEGLLACNCEGATWEKEEEDYGVVVVVVGGNV